MSSIPVAPPARQDARRLFAIQRERQLPPDIFALMGFHPQARHVHAEGSIVSPAYGAALAVAVAYQVPEGHFFALTHLMNLYDGAGFIQGSGSIIWRLDVNQPVGVAATTGHPVRGWENLLMQHGSPLLPWPVAGALIFRSLDVLRWKVDTVAVVGVGAGNYFTCTMEGFVAPEYLLKD